MNKKKNPSEINNNNFMNSNKKTEHQKQISDVQGGFKRFMDNKHEEKKVTVSKPTSHINNNNIKKDNNSISNNPSSTNSINNNNAINHHNKEGHHNEKEFKRTKEEMLKKLGILKKK